MTRALRMLAGVAALTLALAGPGCAYMHDSNPPSGGQCESTRDCFLDELCSDGGACVPGPQTDAGTDAGVDDAGDGGSHAG